MLNLAVGGFVRHNAEQICILQRVFLWALSLGLSNIRHGS